MQLIRRKMVQSAKECIKQQASNTEIYRKMQAVFIEMDMAPSVSSWGRDQFLETTLSNDLPSVFMGHYIIILQADQAISTC